MDYYSLLFDYWSYYIFLINLLILVFVEKLCRKWKFCDIYLDVIILKISLPQNQQQIKNLT
jgi:hypothetical protein